MFVVADELGNAVAVIAVVDAAALAARVGAMVTGMKNDAQGSARLKAGEAGVNEQTHNDFMGDFVEGHSGENDKETTTKPKHNPIDLIVETKAEHIT